MKTVIIIPSRYDSTRFPGKSLSQIAGKTLIQRVWQLACKVQRVDEVYIATDDQRIASYISDIGGKFVMTPEACPTGSDRTWHAVRQLPFKPVNVINLQGDAILTPPWVIQALVDALQQNPSAKIVTPAVRLNEAQYAAFLKSKEETPSSGTTVVFDRNHRALYFSKRVIPYMRNVTAQAAVYRHIGIYGYTYDALAHYATLEQTPLELVEGLEQLRALENGIPIQVVEVDYQRRTHWSIDNPEDVARAEAIMAAEGDLTE